MISLDRAGEYVAPLLTLPSRGGEVPHEQIVLAMKRAFAERCVDDQHASRAFRWLTDGAEFLPMPAKIHDAISITYRVEEADTPPIERRGGEVVIAWRCLTCKDKGLYSRDITTRNGDTYAVCGPCPDCPTGAERALAYSSREAESRRSV